MVVFILLLSLLVQTAKPDVRIPDLEHKIHDAVNAQRKAYSRDGLEWDEMLAKIARAHSDDMVNRHYFKHVNPEGQTPMKRLQAEGYTRCRMVGENIYQNNLYSSVTAERNRKTYDWSSMDEITATTLKGWMDSPGHRENILEKNYRRDGLGVSIAPDDKVYITQVFCAEAE